MESKNHMMQTIFNKLSEKNKDIIILVAKSIKVAQITDEQSYKSSNISNQYKKEYR